MTSAPRAHLTPEQRRARLDAIVQREYADLSPEERAEAAELVRTDVADWKRELAARLASDARERRRTKRQVADLVGQQEGHVGRMINEPEKMSEQFIALLSVCVPGYEHAYIELRRRADRLYLPGGLEAAPRDVKLQEVARALREKLPELQDAVARLMAVSEAAVDDGEPSERGGT